MDEPVTLFLGGDVMTGRGIDQILPWPGGPELWEPYVRDARSYVELAERVSGPIPRPADFAWPWGDLLSTVEHERPDVRLVNLETSITAGGDLDTDKSLHYRMSPANTPCLTAAGLDVCALANNHVLDFGRRGLADTLDTLAAAGIGTAGAGDTASRARQPAIVQLGGGRRAVVHARGAPSSGIPHGWAAARDRPGVALLRRLSAVTADELTAGVRRVKRPGDVVIASIHWGSNWGYDVPAEQVRFAHRIVDGGVDIVHGHSAHHPRPIECYRGKLILYGCGDLVNDYEGISGYEEYRTELRVSYVAGVRPGSGNLAWLRIHPLRAHRMRLRYATAEEAGYLRDVLDSISRPFGCGVESAAGGALDVRPTSSCPS